MRIELNSLDVSFHTPAHQVIHTGTQVSVISEVSMFAASLLSLLFPTVYKAPRRELGRSGLASGLAQERRWVQGKEKGRQQGESLQ